MTDKELLQKCKDEVASQADMNWSQLCTSYDLVEAAKQDIDEVCNLYASKLREKDQGRIKELEGLLRDADIALNVAVRIDYDSYLNCPEVRIIRERIKALNL